MPCITNQFDAGGRPLINVLISPSAAYLAAAGITDAKPKLIQALIDTGASITCLDKEVIKELAIQSKGPIPSSGVHGASQSETYDVDIIIPFGTLSYQMANKLVMECDIKAQGFEMLIGTDIIKQGSLSISQNGGFCFCL